MHDISLDKIKFIEDLLGGDYVHQEVPNPPIWTPRCREADDAIRKGVAVGLRGQLSAYIEENRKSAYAVVIAKLIRALCKKSKLNKRSRRHHIKSEKFLTHPNRGGWLYLFAKNVTLEWLGEKIRIANGDARIREYLETGVKPKATFTEYQEGQAEENKSLAFDPHQFARPLSQHDGLELEAIAHHRQLERVEQIRQELVERPTCEQTFFEEYLVKGEAKTPWERKRFERLRKRIRQALLNQ